MVQFLLCEYPYCWGPRKVTPEYASIILIILSSVLYILFFFFLMWTTFKVFLYFCYHIASVLRFDSLTTKHVESSFPNKGLNPHHLHWKAKSQPLDQQGSPSYWLYWTKVTKETVRVGSGREVQEEGNICMPMTDSCWCMAEISLQYCRPIILQLKNNKKQKIFKI